MNSVRFLAASLVIAGFVFACSDDPGPFFSNPKFPEDQAAFDSTHLGLLTPALRDEDELKAFRLLSGLPIPASAAKTPQPDAAIPDSMSGWRAWNAVSQTVLGQTSSVIAYRNSKRGDTHIWYDNCLDDAFATAAATYAERKTRYQAQADLVSWAQAQVQVFSNCGGTTTTIPEPADSKSALLVRQDRQYQIAAAHFYAEDLEEAEKDFAAVANDGQSPWTRTAAYMVCRTQLRRASLFKEAGQLALARDGLVKIANNPAYGSLAVSANGLAEHIAAIEDPKSAFTHVASVLMAHNPHPDDFAQALQDGSYLLNSEVFSSTVSQPDVADPFRWVYLLGREKDNAAAMAWAAWKSAHTIPALTLASTLVSAADPFAVQLMKEADAIGADSPAYGTLSYDSIRLLIEKGQDAEARERLAKILPGKDAMPPSLADAYSAERMRVATDFQDLLEWAPRKPLPLEGQTSSEPTLAYDAAYVLNYRTPLSKLATAATSPHLPPRSAADIAAATWTRAFIVGNDDVARQMAAAISKDHTAWTDSLTPSADREKWRFRAALLISLRSSFQPAVAVNYSADLQKGGDWWCVVTPTPPEFYSDANAGGYSQIAWKLPTMFQVPDRVLSAPDQSQAQGELKQVQSTGPAQQFLASIVMPYAKAHPDDPDVPQALHRLVMVVRYGCDRSSPANKAISKNAFDLLHSRYPNSEWTKKTPYWF